MGPGKGKTGSQSTPSNVRLSERETSRTFGRDVQVLPDLRIGLGDEASHDALILSSAVHLSTPISSSRP